MSHHKTFKIPALPRFQDSVWTREDYEGFKSRLEKLQYRRRDRTNFPAGYPHTRIKVHDSLLVPDSIQVNIRLYDTDIMQVRVTPSECLVRTQGYNSVLTTKRMHQVSRIITELIGRKWDYDNMASPWMTPEQSVAFHERCGCRYRYDSTTTRSSCTVGPYQFLLRQGGRQNQFVFRGKRYYFYPRSKEDLAELLMQPLPGLPGRVCFTAMIYGLTSKKRELLNNIDHYWRKHPNVMLNHEGVWGMLQWNRDANHIELLLLKNLGVKVNEASVNTWHAGRGCPSPAFAAYSGLVRDETYFYFFVPKHVLKSLAQGKLDPMAEEVLMKIIPAVPGAYRWDDPTRKFTMRDFLLWEANEKTKVICEIKIP